jgi:hypothetical protein
MLFGSGIGAAAYNSATILQKIALFSVINSYSWQLEHSELGIVEISLSVVGTRKFP